MAKDSESKNILVIEDEANIRKFLYRVLQLEGFNVFQAGDGSQGLEFAEDNQVALVMLDPRLPGGVEGCDVLGEFKRGPELSKIPVIVFTASAEDSSREMAICMGAKDYLVEPLSTGGLRSAVTRALH